MTITEIAAQMGVTPETLVQEVVAQGTAKATVFVVFGAFLLIADSPNLIAWKTAPETTANQYIVEHYGGGQDD